MNQKPQESIYSHVSFSIRDTSIFKYITIVINVSQKLNSMLKIHFFAATIYHTFLDKNIDLNIKFK